jgi:hypothetical protein
MATAMGLERFGWHLAFWNIVVSVAICGITYVIGGQDMSSLIG